MIISRIRHLALSLVLVLGASLAHVPPASAAESFPSAAPRVPAFGGLLDDLFSFLHYLGGMLGSIFDIGGGPKDSAGKGPKAGGGSPPGGDHGPHKPHKPESPGKPKNPPAKWNNDWDGKGYKDSYDLWKDFYC